MSPVSLVGTVRSCYRLARTISTMETSHFATVESPVGRLFLSASEKGLAALEFDKGQPGKHSTGRRTQNIRHEERDFGLTDFSEFMRPYTVELEEYFAGKRRKFGFPLDLRGTDFQIACWRALLTIPYGETRTYADIARIVGNPRGFRAVGMANHRNPIAIVVPCHRVLASDGTLCGYGGGLSVKRKLLELEGALSGRLAA
jgi:methylated-DNA-[protein]-cysteine S-methyltransferase